MPRGLDAESIVPWPDIITTGMVSRPLPAHSLSSVMPSMSGIQMSSSTRSGALLARRARRLRVLRQPHAIALVAQDLEEELADADFVVDDEDLVGGHVPVRSRPPSAADDAHVGAVGLHILHQDAPLVLVDDLLHDREPQARALGLGRDIRLEDAAHDSFGDAGAVVAHREQHSCGALARGDQDARRVDPGERVDRVLEQVVEHLPQHGGIGIDLRQVLGQACLDRDAHGLVEDRALRARARSA
jgi:hypothetical protein